MKIRRPSKAAVLLPLALAPLGLLLACSTMSGGGYSEGVSGSESAAARSKKAAEERQKERQRQPDPPRRDPLPPVSPPNNWPEPQPGTAFVIFKEVPKIPALPTGTLILRGVERGAALYVDGQYRGSQSLTLAAGSHEILVQRFGYGEFRAQALVYANSATEVSVEQELIPFSIEALDASPGSFDPGDPGAYGSCAIHLRASAPGRVAIAVLDSRGRKVRDLGERVVGGAFAQFRWDGEDDEGDELPPGAYTIRVSCLEGSKDTGTATVALAPGSFARYSSLYSGVSGALLAPDARVLGPNQAETALGNALINVSPASGMTNRIVSFGGMRIGLPAAIMGLELDFSGMVDLYPELWESSAPIDSGALTLALKYQVLSGPFAAAFFGKATLDSFLQSGDWPTDWDGPTRFSGLSAGMPVEAAAGPLRLFVAPELIASAFYPGYGDGKWEVPGLYTWGYLRGGAELSLDEFAVALSVSLRSQPFNTGFGLRLPVSAGAELRWHSPLSPLVLDLFAAGEFESRSDYYLVSGLCLGLKFQ